jgi:hypothetical protein
MIKKLLRLALVIWPYLFVLFLWVTNPELTSTEVMFLFVIFTPIVAISYGAVDPFDKAKFESDQEYNDWVA